MTLDNLFFQDDLLNVISVLVVGAFLWIFPSIVSHFIVLYLSAGDNKRYRKYGDVQVAVSVWPLYIGTMPLWGTVVLFMKGWDRLTYWTVAKGQARQLPKAIAVDNGGAIE